MSSVICFGGSLKETSVPLVLHRIVQSRAKGTLTLCRPAETIHLFFVEGELKAANSTRAGRRVGDTLLVHGIVPEEEFEEAMRAVEPGRRGRIGKYLVEKGLVTRDVLDGEVRGHFEEIFFSCFSWRDGEFAFLPTFGQLDSDVSLDLPTAALIIEGVRRVGLEPGTASLGDPAFVGRATPLTTELRSLRLSSEEAYFLSLCDGRTRLRDILRLGRSRAEATQTLYTLLACGLIELVPATAGRTPVEEAVPFLRPTDSIDVSLNGTEERDDRARKAFHEARTHLSDGDFYEAVALLRECVHLFPYDVEYRALLADALSHNPLWRRRALVQYKEAVDLDPSREDVLREFAELLLVDEKFRAAYEIASRLVARSPQSVPNLDLLTRCRAALPVDVSPEIRHPPERWTPPSDLPFDRRGNPPER